MGTKKTKTSIRFLTFWAINGSLEIGRLKQQLKAMKDYGFQGTVFHPRYYPNDPPYLGSGYLGILSELILYAKELGMEFWIYDENGWPSGRADGKVMEELGDCVCQWLAYQDGRVCKKEFHQVNTLSEKAMECFVRITYDGYRNGLDPEAFEYVTGFFSDEVGFLDGHGISMQTGGVPWTDDLPEKYTEKYGETMPERLEYLFTEGPGYEKLRTRFWELLADILAENYYGRINAWCRRYGKRYAAHLKGEENLFFQISPGGSAFRNLIRVNTPAVDALGRYPGNHYYPRIAASIGRQFGDGNSMAEILGGSGWGLSPEDVERNIDWLAECGITMYVFHISQYQKNTASVYEDWPPDIPFGVNWRDVFPALFEKLHQRWDDRAGQERPVLITAPVRRVMSTYDPADAMAVNEHNGEGVPDTKSGGCSNRFSVFVEQMYRRGMRFDVAEEWMIEKYGAIRNGKFYLNSQAYDLVIYSEDCRWEETKRVTEFLQSDLFRPSGTFQWTVKNAGKNQILLKDYETKIEYHSGNERKSAAWNVLALDALSKLEIMGEELTPKKKESGEYWYEIPEQIRRRIIRNGFAVIHYEGTAEQPEPLVFLQGEFLVKSTERFQSYDQRQLVTGGSFFLEDYDLSMVDGAHLAESGFPFMRECITLECEFYIDTDHNCRLGADEHIYAEAAKIYVDGREAGYTWGDEWRVDVPEPGLHTIIVDLIPSTYNTYGPHHYYKGDYHTISPAQYRGKKNFADAPNAPEHTHTDEWHFVKFGIQ